MKHRFFPAIVVSAAAASLALSGCVPGEGSAEAREAKGGELNIDFATYNPLSLIIKAKGWLDKALDDDITVNWLQSHGSNKANQALRAEAIDVGSTAGSAALLARANGSAIKTIDIYSQPEWSALVTTPESGIETVEDLRGKSIAATKGTDPYFFLLQALDAHGVGLDEVKVQNIQHADGRVALRNGSVDAWSGLDPIMAAGQEKGDVLFYRNVDFNTYGFLNATESFLEEQPEAAQTVVDVYEHARAWALEHPEETIKIQAEASGISKEVAATVIERTNLSVDPAPGEAQLKVLERVGPIFVETGDVSSQEQIDEALNTLLEDKFVKQAKPETVGAS